MDGFDAFIAEVRAMAAEADEELERTCRHAVSAAVDAAKTTAISTKRYQNRSGDLTKSIDGYITASGKTWATGVFEATAEYATFVDEGTKPHVIRPKAGKYLTFPGKNGGTVFAREVNHPGTKPDGFFERGVDAAVKVLDAEVDAGLGRIHYLIIR